jgi:hypothetical protein
MLARTANAAQSVAARLASRRGFLSWLGKQAMKVAGGVGAFLAVPSLVQARSSLFNVICCGYLCTAKYTVPQYQTQQILIGYDHSGRPRYRYVQVFVGNVDKTYQYNTCACNHYPDGATPQCNCDAFVNAVRIPETGQVVSSCCRRQPSVTCTWTCCNPPDPGSVTGCGAKHCGCGNAAPACRAC